MRRLLVGVLTVLAVALSATTASADHEPATPVSGDWTYVPAVVGFEEFGPHLLLYGTDVGTWTGTFEGTSYEEFTLMFHASGDNYYRGLMEFEGTVDGRSGTMIIQAWGVQSPGGIEPGTGGDWSGSWVILSGTGELEGIEGRGSFAGPSLDLDYWGKVRSHA